jgi:hypothetical protein
MLPACESNTSMSTLPALQTLSVTLWACMGKGTRTRPNRSAQESLHMVFSLVGPDRQNRQSQDQQPAMSLSTRGFHVSQTHPMLICCKRRL